MLKTALQPRWLATLALALILATVFVVLSAWQFGRSQIDDDATGADPATAGSSLEEALQDPTPLTEVIRPGEPMGGPQADRVVSLRGEFVEGTEVLIDQRLQGDREGYWAVAAFAVDGAPDGQVIPVVRGWVADPDDADAAPSDEELTVVGRLLPTEAPEAEPRPDGRVLPSLSVAELINRWDVSSYSGFVVAFSAQPAGAADPTGESDGAEVDAAAEGSPLESVWVGPQPEGPQIHWLNVFYGVEWTVFAGFAFYLWGRLVKDDHERRLEEERLDREWEEQWRREQLARRAEQSGRPAGDAGSDGPEEQTHD
ncbi:SURF1 family protein [Nesterenkonia sp. F]|uniref:SURF1 family protein n=1 Tax=Nesterenkonia sp. F TaxID=795955 RepID=UPI000255D75F|nr:SURF1 family cytochrome oxidase biogenesis protein [Nesterenkonia sp. F]